MGNISSWAIKNPIAPLVLFFIFTILGLGSFFKLPINSNPDIDYPAFSVDISMPGAAPSEIENQITQKVEGALTGIEGIKKMNSTAQTSHSSTMVELQIGTDVSKAVDDARAAISQIRSELPADIYEPIVSRIDFNSQDPVGIFALRAPTMTDEQISWFIDNDISRQILAVKGVGQVNRFGGADRQISVDIDPAKLNAFGGTASDVSNALRMQNVDSPGGTAEAGSGQQSIRTLGSAASVEELRKTPITLNNGKTLRLEDVADVRDGAEDIKGISRLNDTPVIMFQVLRTKSASGLKTYRAVEEKIADIEKDHPEIKISTAYTPAEYIQSDYDSSLQSLIEGALLATLVVSVFLGGWRSILKFSAICAVILFGGAFLIEHFTKTHIGEVPVLAVLTLLIAIYSFLRKDGRATFLAAMAIPLSTIPTFYIMELMGFTLNGITLLALGLVAGILVDDAIVEIENIERHIDMGKRPYPAALEAADEIGLAVVATTSTIVAVFVPVSFMTGIVGQFFKSFGITVAVAVICSLLVARMLTPLMAAYLLSPRSHEEKEGKIGSFYMNVLKWALHNRWKTFAIGIAIMIISVVSATKTPTTFMPSVDDGMTQISIDLPPGLTPQEADYKSRQVGNIILDEEGTKGVVQSVKSDLTGANYFITLTDRKDRSVSKKEFETNLRTKISQIPGIRGSFGNGFGSNSVSISLVSNDPKALDNATSNIMSEMRKYKWVLDLKSSADITKPELHIVPRREEAARLGVSVAQIASAIRVATDGDLQTNLPKFNAGDRQIPILVRLSRENRANIESVKSLRIATNSGITVPLSAVADVSFGGGQARVSREDRQRVVTISASLGTDDHGKQMQLGTALKTLQSQDWYKHPGEGVSIKQSGEGEELGDMVGQFIGAIILGVFLVYCVLVVLFKDFLQPITIISVIILAPAGAFLGLFMVQQPLSITAFIGLLMLIGIATKNSILLVDFTIESVAKGMDRYDAILDAAHKRSRPIIMTTIAMIAGMIPNAVTSAGPGAFRQSMAIAVIGGLLLSTVLSLVFVPAVYTLVDDFDHFIRKLFRGVTSVTPEDKAQGLLDEQERHKLHAKSISANPSVSE